MKSANILTQITAGPRTGDLVGSGLEFHLDELGGDEGAHLIVSFTKNKKENLGWYGGIYLGQVIKEGDWAIDIEYVVVQAQAVPDADISSIGRGNIFNEGLFDEMDDLGSLDIPRRGNGNFYGWRLNYLYALTDNLTADFVYQWSQAQNRRIGGTHSYHDFEMEVIYAF